MTGDQEPTAALIAAAHWLTLLDEQGVSERTRQDFHEWYASDPRHAAAFNELTGAWPVFDDLFGLLAAERAADNVVVPPQQSIARTPSRAPRRRPLAFAAFAGGLILAVLSIAVGVSVSTPTPEAVYASAIGQLRTIVFADGSIIALDAGSRVRVAYSADLRRVELISGRALFDVADDENRPFVVDTLLGAVQVTGTSFVVQVSPSKVRTSVLHGRVRGEPRIDWRPQALLARLTHSPARAIHASAGEEFTFLRDGRAPAASPVSRFDPAQRLAWRSAMLAFDGEPLAEAALEVTRHTGVSFAFDDPRVGETAILAYFAADDADRFIAHLARMGVSAETVNAHRYRLFVRAANASPSHFQESQATTD